MPNFYRTFVGAPIQEPECCRVLHSAIPLAEREGNETALGTADILSPG